MPLVDPITREKVKFNPKVVEEGHISADQLMNEGGWGGDVHFEYDHDKYWPALLEMSKKRRDEQLERWRALGGTVGLDEWSIKGGPKVTDEVPISNEAPVKETPENGAPITEAPVKEEPANETLEDKKPANGEPVQGAPPTDDTTPNKSEAPVAGYTA